MSNESIKTFKYLSSKDIASAGGKGASLGEMTRAKIPVPPGFVILASVFGEFIEQTRINVEIDAMWDRLDVTNTEEIERNSELTQGLIMAKEFPKDLGKEILKEFSNLKTKYVAVRSSATAEDSKFDAWAGQLDSYLYIDKKGLLKAVQKCWASLFTPRAIFYKLERGLKNNNVTMAVVVQKMVDSDISGVCFTVHPVTRDNNQMIVEACFGLGEALVQGIITPDSYVIEKNSLNIIDVNIGGQEKQIVKARGGTKEKLIPERLKYKQKLTERQIRELAKICIDIEKHYGDPRDIEWAIHRNKPHILQARPITTLNK